MIRVINYAHPFTDQQLVTLTDLVRETPTVCEVVTHIDRHQPMADVARRLADAAQLAPQAWQTERIILNPPALAPLALALLAEIHGRCGYFPPVLNIRPVGDALPPMFEVGEIINLQQLRDQAREQRTANAPLN